MKSERENAKTGGNQTSAKLWLMRLAAVVVMPILFLLLIELGLRICGYGHPTAFLLPSVNHGKKTWIENNEFGWRFFGRRKERTPAAISILQEKPAAVTRIFVFGESAAFGDPQPAFGLPRVLQATLSLRHPEMKFEVVNTAMTAINSHVILPIARDCAKAGGDIWVIYMGNNEVVGPFGAGTVFGTRAMPLPLVRANLALKTTRIGQCLDALREKWQEPPADKSEWGGMLMFLDRQIREDDPGMKTVYQSFEKNLADIVRAGHESGAGVVVSTVAVNLKDCAPFASAGGKADDPGGAEGQFRLAQSLLAAGDFNGAQKAFSRALDLDTLRFRCDSRLNDIIRKTAANREGERIFLADAVQSFCQSSPGGVPGWDLFYEHVHLTFEGNCLLARSLAEQVEKLLPPEQPETVRPWPSVAECASLLGRTDRDLQAALTEVLGRLEDPPFVTQINHAEQMKHLTTELEEAGRRANLPDAVRAAQTALKLDPDDPQLCQQLAEAEESSGQYAEAELAALQAADLLPSSAEDWSRLGLILAQEKKFEPAVRAFQRSFALSPQDVSPLQNMAMSLVKLGRKDEAVKRYEQALSITPRFGLAWLGLGEVLEEEGRGAEATNCFQKALQNRIHRAPDLATLARFCAGRGWLQAAATNFDDALKLDPSDPALTVEAGRAHFLFAMELGKTGQSALAAQEFGEATRLMPQVVEARLNFGIALYRAGRRAEAAKQFAEVLKQAPENRLARHYLELLQTESAPGAR